MFVKLCPAERHRKVKTSTCKKMKRAEGKLGRVI